MSTERPATGGSTSLDNRQLEKLELEIRSLRNSVSLLSRLVPLFAIVAAVISFAFGIYQMRVGFDNNMKILEAGFANNVKISEKEFRRKFYEEQFARYLEISELAAKLTATDDPGKLQEGEQRLLELRNGKMIVIAENQELLNSVDKFSEVLCAYKDKKVTKYDLAMAARNLAAACRNSLKGFWQIPIDPVPADSTKQICNIH